MTLFLDIGPIQILLVLVFALLFPLIAVFDIVRNEFIGNNKVVWLLVVILFSLIGTILYFTIGRQQRIK